MRKVLALLIFALALGACGRPLTQAAALVAASADALSFASESDIAHGDVIEASYIVAFRPTLEPMAIASRSFTQQANFLQNFLADGVADEPEVADLNYMTSFDWRRIAPLDKAASFLVPPALRLGFDEKMPAVVASVAEVKFRSNEEAKETLSRWLAEGRIWYAEPNGLSEVRQEGETGGGSGGGSGWDAYAKTYKDMQGTGGALWHKMVKTAEAMESLGKAGVTANEGPLVAILDSGVDVQHDKLKNRVWLNEALNQAGCENDQFGCNATQARKGSLGNGDVWPAGTSGYGQKCDAPCTDAKGDHGTHVAGLVAADPASDYGGVCPVCKFVVVKVVGKPARGEGKEGSIADSSIIAGFTYVSRFTSGGKSAIRIINASIGKFQRSRTVGILVRLLYSSGSGILLVAAAGNEDTDRRAYPAAFEEALAVSNVQSQDAVRHFTSNYGRWVDISAPGSGTCQGSGDGLMSTLPGNTQGCKAGTSMATPMVSGVAALVVAKNPDISARALRDRLITTADPQLYNEEGNKPYIPNVQNEKYPLPLLGSGVVDALAAVDNKPSEGRPPNEALRRVTSDCGAISAPGTPGGRHALSLWLALGAPLAVGIWRKRRRG